MKNNHLIVQKNVSIGSPTFLLAFFGAVITYSVLPLFLLADFYLFVFQNTYFRIFKIPLLKRNDFVQIDRQKLPKLTFIQKVNCVYCGYANGMSAYLKAVVNQMEVYSCAIKHVHQNSATNHQKLFYNYEDFK